MQAKALKQLCVWSGLLAGTLSHPRSDCCAAAVDGKLLAAGGWTTDYSDTLGSVELYDPATDTWTLLNSNLTTPRGDCEAVALESRCAGVQRLLALQGLSCRMICCGAAAGCGVVTHWSLGRPWQACSHHTSW